MENFQEAQKLQVLGKMPESIQENALPLFVQNRALRMVKFLISTVFYLLRLAFRALSRLLGQRQPSSAVSIYYHQVFPEQRARFARQMDYLQRLTEPIRADRTEPLRAGVRYAMVTTDDGWSSFVENALPEMRARNIPVTIFVIAGRLGDSMGEAADHIMSDTELRALAPDLASGLVTIGSHTSTHACLTTLNRSDAWREVTESRARLEQVLDRTVNLFCFPFSMENAEAVELCRAAGYERVFGGRPAPALRDPHEFLIGRMRADPDDGMFEFHLKLMGAYDWVPFAADLKRRIFETLGRHRRRMGSLKQRRPIVAADGLEHLGQTLPP